MGPEQRVSGKGEQLRALRLLNDVPLNSGDSCRISQREAPRFVTPNGSIPGCCCPGVADDRGSGLFHLAEHLLSAQPRRGLDQQPHLSRADTHGMYGPTRKPAGVSYRPLAESCGSWYFQQLSAAVRGADDMVPPSGGRRVCIWIHGMQYVCGPPRQSTRNCAAGTTSFRSRVELAPRRSAWRG